MKNLTENIKQAVYLLNCFNGLDRLYWLDVLVTGKVLTKAEAGYIVVYKLI